MGILYVVGMPAGGARDLTFRARRILEAATLVVAGSRAQAQAVLAPGGIVAPLAGLEDPAPVLEALAGGDVALLQDGRRPGPGAGARRLIAAALDGGYAVVPIPGPALALTALVISGLPADTFLYLGDLPPTPAGRRSLWASAAGEERTLVALVPAEALEAAVGELHAVVGDRTLVLVGVSEAGTEVAWRGSLAAAARAPEVIQQELEPFSGVKVLVIGGGPEEKEIWDEGRLRAAVRAGLEEGLGAKGVSQALSGDSGWPRRRIYDLAVEIGREGAGQRGPNA